MHIYLTTNEIELIGKIWHVRCGEKWLGPYSYPELCLMIQKKSINRHQFVRSDDMSEWKKMSDFVCFSQKFIKRFLENYSPRSDIQKVRAHIRIEVENTPMILVRDGEVIQVECKQLSAGGCRVEVPFEKLKLKDEVKMHFPFNEKLKIKSFNVEAKILRMESLSIVEGKNEKETFSAQFLNLRPASKKSILKFIQKEIRKICEEIKHFEAQEAKLDFVNLGIRRSDLMRIDTKKSITF